MLIIKNAISDSTMNHVKNEINENLTRAVWASNEIIWSPDIMKGITGSTMIKIVGEGNKILLENELKKYLPEYTELTFQYYVWQKNSGISMHVDPKFKFGATVYLNKKWDFDYGGIFIFENFQNDDPYFRAFCPEYNTLLISDKNEKHMVTPVSVIAPFPRITIQIWGL
jgi:hypothetical protein